MQVHRSETGCRILAVEETSAGTMLEVCGPGDRGDARRVRTGTHPDRVTARRLLACNRRADWVVVDLEGGGVVGVNTHRAPRRMRVSLPVALGLAEAGVPAFLPMAGSGVPA